MQPHARILLVICISLILLPACNTPGEPPAEQPPLASGYFPPLALGDTLIWDYTYYNLNAGALMDMVQGTMRWRVTSVDNSSGRCQVTIRQEFIGVLTKRRSDTPYVRDSTWIPMDVTYGAINEDANHSVTVTTEATGQYANYGGKPATFPRFPAGAVEDTLQVTGADGSGGFGTTVKAKKDFGLVYYFCWIGPGMTSYRTTMKRR